VPSVASEASLSVRPALHRPKPAGTRAAESPFSSLIDAAQDSAEPQPKPDDLRAGDPADSRAKPAGRSVPETSPQRPTAATTMPQDAAPQSANDNGANAAQLLKAALVPDPTLAADGASSEQYTCVTAETDLSDSQESGAQTGNDATTAKAAPLLQAAAVLVVPAAPAAGPAEPDQLDSASQEAAAAPAIPDKPAARAAHAEHAEHAERMLRTQALEPTPHTSKAAGISAEADQPGEPAQSHGLAPQIQKGAEQQSGASPQQSGMPRMESRDKPEHDPQAPAQPEAAHSAASTQSSFSGADARVVSVPAATHAAGPAQTHAAPQSAVQQPVPVEGVALEIAAHARAGKSRFEIRLDPPDLGRIDVRLDVDRDGRVISRLVIDRAETLDLLRRDAPSLERALQDAGLKTSDQSLQFSLRDQTARHHDGDTPTQPAQLVLTDDEMPDSLPRGYGRPLTAHGAVDIRV
jgi:flagellar hook-length control protein FliK